MDSVDRILKDAWSWVEFTRRLSPLDGDGARVVLRGAARMLQDAQAALRDQNGGALLERVNRHQRTYQTRGLPAFECSLIDHQVMAGRNPLTERDVEWLEAMRVTHVLDLREAWEWAGPRFGGEAVGRLAGLRTCMTVVDQAAPAPETLDCICDFLTRTLANPGALVYIHCRAGRERTGAVLVAYFARRHGLSYDAALAALRQRRPNLEPLPNQERAVRNWLM